MNCRVIITLVSIGGWDSAIDFISNQCRFCSHPAGAAYCLELAWHPWHLIRQKYYCRWAEQSCRTFSARKERGLLVAGSSHKKTQQSFKVDDLLQCRVSLLICKALSTIVGQMERGTLSFPSTRRRPAMFLGVSEKICCLSSTPTLILCNFKETRSYCVPSMESKTSTSVLSCFDSLASNGLPERCKERNPVAMLSFVS